MHHPREGPPPYSVLTHYNCISSVASAQIEAQTVLHARENSSTGQIKKASHEMSEISDVIQKTPQEKGKWEEKEKKRAGKTDHKLVF